MLKIWLGFLRFLTPAWGFIVKYLLVFSTFIMLAFGKISELLKRIFGIGVFSAAASSGGFSNFLVKMFFWQGLIWLCSLALTILIGYFASDVISYLLDIVGIQGYVNDLIEPIKKAGASFNKIGISTTNVGGVAAPPSALGNVNYVKVFEYFSFEKYLNYALATIFGFVILKLNIILFKAINKASSLPGNMFGGPLGGS